MVELLATYGKYFSDFG